MATEPTTAHLRSLVAALLLTAWGAAGCGGASRQVSDQARLLALYTDNVRQEAERFSSARDQIARSRLRNITLLERGAFEAEEELEYELELQRFVEDEARLRLYEGVLEATDRAVERRARRQELQARQEGAVDRMRGRVAIRIARLREASRALAELTAKPEFRDQVMFYRGFFTQVQDQLRDMRARIDADARRTLEDSAVPPEGGPPGGS